MSVGYKYVLQDSLPTLSYLTKIDEFALLSFTTLVLSAFRECVAFELQNSTFDYVSFAVLWILYLFLNTYLFYTMYAIYKKKIKDAEDEYAGPPGFRESYNEMMRARKEKAGWLANFQLDMVAEAERDQHVTKPVAEARKSISR